MPLLLCLPPALALCVFLEPFPPPTGGYSNQILLWTFGMPLAASLIGALMPFYRTEVMGLPRTSRSHLLNIAWALVFGALTSASNCAISAGFGVFPVPFTIFLAMPLLVPLLPVLWWMVPAELRVPGSLRRFVVSLAA